MNDPVDKSREFPVLLLLPNWLGDAVMACGLLELLHRNRHLPDGRILRLTVGVRDLWAPLFRDDPRCDELLTVQRHGRHAGVAGIWRQSQDLKKGGFQAVLLGPPSLRAALAAQLAGINLRFGYRGDGRDWLLKPAVTKLPRGQLHYFQEQLELGRLFLTRLGLNPGPDSMPDRPELPGCQSVAVAGPEPHCPRWILAPGATYGLAKTWPRARAGELARLALDQHGVELVILGDDAARGYARDLAAELQVTPENALQGRPGLVDLTGRTDLMQAVGVLRSSSGFVGNDSGLMHLAAALGIPTVGVFGSSNPDWTAPRGESARALVASGFPCQPCYRKTCNQPTFCLDTLKGRQVLDALLELLDTQPTTRGGPV